MKVYIYCCDIKYCGYQSESVYNQQHEKQQQFSRLTLAFEQLNQGNLL